MKTFVIFLGLFLTIVIVSALTMSVSGVGELPPVNCVSVSGVGELPPVNCVSVSGVGELPPVNCVSVTPVSSGSRVHECTPAQLRHYTDIYLLPLLLSLDQLSVCRDLGLVKKRTRRGTCGRKKQRQIQVIVTPRVEYNMVGTKTAPTKVRDESSHRIPVKINKTECKTSCPTYLKVMCISAQSCRQKTLAIRDAVSDNRFDVAFFTETGLYSQGDEVYVAQMTPEGYFTKSFPWEGKRGGGIAVTMRNSLKEHCTFHRLPSVAFEGVSLKIKCKDIVLQNVCTGLHRVDKLNAMHRLSSLNSMIF